MVIIIMGKQFDASHYVPILRWKEAERGALSQLDNAVSASLTPLVELVPENFLKADKSVMNTSVVTNKIAGQLFKSWGERPFFIDLYNLPKDTLSQGSSHTLTMLGEYANILKLSLIPVIGINRDTKYKIAVRTVLSMFGQGTCLRLTLADIEQAELEKSINEVISTLGVTPKDTDLLIDYQILDQSAPKFKLISGKIPYLTEWRNFIIASGAFPEDLSKLQKNQKHVLQRSDWITWKNQTTRDVSLRRMPTYSDYTIQHAVYRRHAGRLRYSASIRYTAEDSWIIMRGEDVFNRAGPGFKQYPDWAILLCDLPEYCGEEYCVGDKYMKDMSQQTEKTGDASEWLRAGINHHMTFVVRQLATLCGA